MTTKSIAGAKKIVKPIMSKFFDTKWNLCDIERLYDQDIIFSVELFIQACP